LERIADEILMLLEDATGRPSPGRQRAERRLREALERDLLVLEYQPIVDFGHGRVVGAEALIRMRDPEDGGLLSPDMFMDVAEDTGLVVEVDCWVIEAAIRQITRWGRRPGPAGEPPWLAINVSARSMEHPRVVKRLVDAVTSGELSRDQIKVELTEHSFLGALPGGEASLRSLMAAGVRVGIDDFGTGYSALAYLRRFTLDFMKIDRSFVQDVGRVERADAVVTAIVDLAHAHGMLVVAEGVETSRQARRLRDMGCVYAQGYHFGRPGAASRIVRR
jgi:EAL domain-containing protein (putative c-di-GMP-specific phosphodiesterase class I)